MFRSAHLTAFDAVKAAFAGLLAEEATAERSQTGTKASTVLLLRGRLLLVLHLRRRIALRLRGRVIVTLRRIAALGRRITALRRISKYGVRVSALRQRNGCSKKSRQSPCHSSDRGRQMETIARQSLPNRPGLDAV
ncbi:uncharacterized protein BDW47DRAFT_107404 [Aspergillus candidus]|uniref:Uncharacterized protein n=1 Tax=Aspergillus candidus TaxID=41067 RepID=A0A2I2F902_ASPCN|nr:hypothetical protein BDW47DRAFT_107404 [Aspergillus candidus]PLB37114.1 hypothetical protein BDW47DRAFT_107404 [Aspergillus candidus]